MKEKVKITTCMKKLNVNNIRIFMQTDFEKHPKFRESLKNIRNNILGGFYKIIIEKKFEIADEKC